MKQSMRRYLMLRLTGFLVPVLLALGFALDVSVARSLRRQFDVGLQGRVRDFATVVEREPAQYELEFDYATLPEYVGGGRAAYFEIWDQTETTLTRSPSLGETHLPLPTLAVDESRIVDHVLPDGRPGRLAALRFIPRLDSDIPAADAPRFQDPVTIAVACGTEDVLAALAMERRWLVLLCGAAVVLVLVGVWWSVGRGLRPLHRLAVQINDIDERDLSRRVDLGPVPQELLPPVRCLNLLLARLERSFERERQFATNASHELRTPLAALQMVLEVSMANERSASDYRTAMTDAHRMVLQMNRLAESLLTLARAEDGAHVVDPSSVPMRAFVDACWEPHVELSQRRGLRFCNELDDDFQIRSDIAHLWIVLANLLANAASYTETGGEIRVRGPVGSVLVEVWDSGPEIPDADIPRLFDRLWRGDQARSDSALHCGLGLALAQAHAKVLGLRIEVARDPRGGVTFALQAEPASRDVLQS